MFLFATAAVFYVHLCAISAEYGKLSRQMCEEYAKAVYVDAPDLGMSLSARSKKVPECGMVTTPLILGGKKAHIKEYPHFALIGYGQNPDGILQYECGGSLISELFVLSAAHCEKSVFGRAKKVALGMIKRPTTDVDKDDYGTQREYVEEMIKHPEYDEPYNDIALFRLRNKVTFTPYVRPACLNTKLVISEPKAEVIGFGVMKNSGIKLSENLLKLTVEFFPHKECKEDVESEFVYKGIEDSMLCTRNKEVNKDTCAGDSGGPMHLTLNEPYCMYSIVGITSFGFECGLKNHPSIYTNVSHFIPWIEETVWKKKY